MNEVDRRDRIKRTQLALPKENHDVAIPRIEPIRRSVLLLALRIFIILFIADSLYAGIILIWMQGVISEDFRFAYGSLLLVVHTLKNIALIYIIVGIVVNWASDFYYISEHHLIHRQGILGTTENVYHLERIDAVTITQSWLGKLMDYGDVKIRVSTYGGVTDLSLQAINDPRKFHDFFTHYV